MRIIFFLVIGCSLAGCKKTFEANDNLSKSEYEEVLMKVAPYVIKKRDDMNYDDRFKAENQPYYKRFIEKANGELKYFQETDTASIFFFSYRDLSSLYEHYQGLGGYYKTDENGNITFLNLLYHTPRFTKEEATKKDLILFKEMVTKGSMKRYIGNRKFVHTPNSDFYYDTKANRWGYTPNSSWIFLKEEERKEAATGDSVN
jgi:hypothetical protein